MAALERRTPYRLYLAWMAWLDMEWERPSRADFYAMSIACEVRRKLSDKPEAHKLSHMKLTFPKPEKREAPTVADVDRMKQMAMARVGGAKIVRVPRVRQ